MVPPASHRISRVPRYSGYIQLLSPSLTGLSPSPAALSNALQLSYRCILMSSTPAVRRQPVWPLPSSLATTKGIDFSFFSSGYLDVSVHRVAVRITMCSLYDVTTLLVTGSPIRKSPDQCYIQLPEAYRCSSRPSSASSAKAFTMRP